MTGCAGSLSQAHSMPCHLPTRYPTTTAPPEPARENRPAHLPCARTQFGPHHKPPPTHTPPALHPPPTPAFPFHQMTSCCCTGGKWAPSCRCRRPALDSRGGGTPLCWTQVSAQLTPPHPPRGAQSPASHPPQPQQIPPIHPRTQHTPPTTHPFVLDPGDCQFQSASSLSRHNTLRPPPTHPFSLLKLAAERSKATSCVAPIQPHQGAWPNAARSRTSITRLPHNHPTTNTLTPSLPRQHPPSRSHPLRRLCNAAGERVPGAGRRPASLSVAEPAGRCAAVSCRRHMCACRRAAAAGCALSLHDSNASGAAQQSNAHHIPSIVPCAHPPILTLHSPARPHLLLTQQHQQQL